MCEVGFTMMHYYPGYSQCRSGSTDLGLIQRRNSSSVMMRGGRLQQQEQEPTDSGESTLSELDGKFSFAIKLKLIFFNN